GGIRRDLAMAVADVVYESHNRAQRARCCSAAAQMRELVRSVCRSLAGAQAFRQHDVVQFSRLAEAHLARAAPILDERARCGAVRHCHGDLHLANIVLWHEHPLLYDAIEFDEAIATIDVLYDLAFLLMDLDWHGQTSAANMIFNRYLWRSHNELDLRGLRAL